MFRKGISKIAAVIFITAILTFFVIIGLYYSQPKSSFAQQNGKDQNGKNSDSRDSLNPYSGDFEKYTQQVREDSHFGFHSANFGNYYSYLSDLGVNWSREGMYFIWTLADAKRKGNFDFTFYDHEKLQANTPNNINIVANICPFGRGGKFLNEEEKDIYARFVENTVARYGGGGSLGCAEKSPDCYKSADKQYPANEVISRFKRNNPIKYWQVCNQLVDTCGGPDCKTDYAGNFAEVQKITYNAIKKVDSSAQVLIAGDSRITDYPEVFKKLNGNYIDIIDLHHFGTENGYDLKKDIDYLKTSLRNSNFDLNKLKFWITETGTYSGKPLGDDITREYNYQDEKQQARGLLKIYVSAFARGIDKVFWAWGLMEGFGCSCCIFDYTGLIYANAGVNPDGKHGKCGSPDYDLGYGVKKLGYYTYKLMVEKLKYSDWSKIEASHESDGVYIYKFTNKQNGRLTWVAWNDSKTPKTVSLTLNVNTEDVRITQAIPAQNSGKEVTDYHRDFKEITGTISSTSPKRLTFVLDDTPVFIEEVYKVSRQRMPLSQPPPPSAGRPSPEGSDDISTKLTEFRLLLSRQTDAEKIKKATDIDIQSREAFRAGDPVLTLKLLNSAIDYLKGNDNVNLNRQ
ncbi:hypothetical protein [Candidatus Magnetominusculus dajiuhuensis]|uniref:hypothetical protein n=1 Tax=Candidatus Magnetominusculus dajiuhuensis TaxID=3137712 RepID=UPI003B436EB2